MLSCVTTNSGKVVKSSVLVKFTTFTEASQLNLVMFTTIEDHYQVVTVKIVSCGATSGSDFHHTVFTVMCTVLKSTLTNNSNASAIVTICCSISE